ncbi:hypothetical protein QR98_0027440 [Sarcoptes scabiei]|uniref:Uncharacterized protein n=1 Tax=Sarcoptes scabiei TaxID=52283 RepID=A0A132A085_SARSC|nr:hypothetical protein QR98_0027440 [Sarcoptes scabiei]
MQFSRHLLFLSALALQSPPESPSLLTIAAEPISAFPFTPPSVVKIDDRTAIALTTISHKSVLSNFSKVVQTNVCAKVLSACLENK